MSALGPRAQHRRWADVDGLGIVSVASTDASRVSVGAGLGVSVGAGLGVSVGAGLGVSVGGGLGVSVGAGLGVSVGLGVGVGVLVGLGVGVGVAVGCGRGLMQTHMPRSGSSSHSSHWWCDLAGGAETTAISATTPRPRRRRGRRRACDPADSRSCDPLGTRTQSTPPRPYPTGTSRRRQHSDARRSRPESMPAQRRSPRASLCPARGDVPGVSNCNSPHPKTLQLLESSAAHITAQSGGPAQAERVARGGVRPSPSRGRRRQRRLRLRSLGLRRRRRGLRRSPEIRPPAAL